MSHSCGNTGIDNYTNLLENLINVNNLKGEPLSNERLRQAVIDEREETDAGHERNSNGITCDDSYQSPTKNKDVSTIKDSVYYESDEHVYRISDSNKQVDPKNDPIAETHIFDRVCNLSVRVGLSEDASDLSQISWRIHAWRSLLKACLRSI